MKYKSIKAFDLPDAWWKVLKTIWDEGDTFTVQHGSELGETKKLNLTIEVTNPEIRPIIHQLAPNDMDYVNGYSLNYLWNPVADDSSYTYGSRLRTPIDQLTTIANRFVEYAGDRQCTAVVRLQEDILKEMKHPPCLSLLDFELSNNKLHMTGYFRSWDAYGGFPANQAGLQLINEAIVSIINSKTDLNYTTGKMVFHSKNCHIYDRQYELVKELFSTRSLKELKEEWTNKD